MRKVLLLVALTTMALPLVACGGKSDAEKASEAAAASGNGRGTITCDGSATTKATGLPSDFPQPDAVIYVNAKKTGPTVVVDGYSTESLEGMYIEYKDRVTEAGYQLQFSEIEKDRGDSEVAYKTKSTEGIIALRGGSACANGNVSVHITNRPS